jgi:hypothetical protein
VDKKPTPVVIHRKANAEPARTSPGNFGVYFLNRNIYAAFPKLRLLQLCYFSSWCSPEKEASPVIGRRIPKQEPVNTPPGEFRFACSVGPSLFLLVLFFFGYYTDALLLVLKWKSMRKFREGHQHLAEAMEECRTLVSDLWF